MRITRPFVLGVALLFVAPGVPAGAAACPMLIDTAGDVRDVEPDIGIPDPKLDLRSASITGTKTAFALEIRVHGAALAEPDPYAPGGRIYFAIADVGTGAASSGPWIGLYLILDPAGGVWDYAAATFTNPDRVPVAQNTIADAGGVTIDNANGKIRLWSTYEGFDATGVEIRPGTRVRRMWAFTARWVAGTPQSWGVDTAEKAMSYRFGGRGCIPVGR